MASEEAKPDGVFEVKPDEVESFMAPQPVRALPGIGPKSAEALSTLRIDTLGQLASHAVGPIRRALGPNVAGWLQLRAQGIGQLTGAGARQVEIDQCGDYLFRECC